MIGTDYGHHDPSTEINAVGLLRDDRRISAHAVQKISKTIRVPLPEGEQHES